MTEYKYLRCPVCTVSYAVDATFMEHRRTAPPGDPDRHWFCPQGHRLAYTKSAYTQERQWRKAAEGAARFERDAHTTTKRRAAAYKGHFNRVASHVRAGTCPACDQVFPALEEHMAKAHPGWDPEAPRQETAETEEGDE